MKNQISNTIKFKTMKKLGMAMFAFLVLSSFSYAQSIFDKFEDKKEVGSIILNQKMFRMLATMGMDLDDPEAKENVNMVGNITSLKVFTTDDDKTSAEMKATVEKYLKSANLEELMRMKDGDKTVKFYVKEGKDENHVKELLMFVTGLKEVTKNADIEVNGKKRVVETVLLTITGDIDLRQISKITNKLDIPGGEELKKAKSQ